MAIFYRPDKAVLGDMIPFYDDGKFKPFYLRNFRHNRDAQHQDSWVMLTTEDHVHFTEHDTKIRGGTGSVIKVDGVYHMFYCTFKEKPARNYINHAVSEDLVTWTPIEEDTFRSDDQIYRPVDWRDPFVFWNEEEKCWWMILCAQAQGQTQRQACVGLCKSEDLHHWTVCEPLYAPHNAACAFECPDLFKMGEWYYLVFSSYADRFQTLYRMSKSLQGPWITPEIDTFDTRAFYAAKTGTDGQRRFVYGWNPTRECDEHTFDPLVKEGLDCNSWDWGGNLVVHEVRQKEDGTLWVSPLPEVLSAFDHQEQVGLQPLSGPWQTGENCCEVHVPYSYAALMMNQMPETCRLSFDVTLLEKTASLGVALQVDERFAEGCYGIIDPFRQRIEYRTSVRMTEKGGQKFPHEVELERPLPRDLGSTYHVDVLVDDTVIVFYIGGRVAMGTRLYDWKNRHWGLFASEGAVRFDHIEIWTQTK